LPKAQGRRLDRLVLGRLPGHARQSARYETALRERNRLLAEPFEPDRPGSTRSKVQLARRTRRLPCPRRLVADLSRVLDALPEAPFARPALAYLAEHPADEEALARALREGRRRDRAAGRTLTGPHRDDLSVRLAAKDAPAAACSTGEQKAMLIAIVLAHAELAHLQTGGPGARLLLLDEIAAHLDPLRRAALYERLAASGAQVWMTGTEMAPLPRLQGEAALWDVRDGIASRI
jgi:DNA replication and repair protein RecF